MPLAPLSKQAQRGQLVVELRKCQAGFEFKLGKASGGPDLPPLFGSVSGSLRSSPLARRPAFRAARSRGRRCGQRQSVRDCSARGAAAPPLPVAIGPHMHLSSAPVQWEESRRSWRGGGAQRVVSGGRAAPPPAVGLATRCARGSAPCRRQRCAGRADPRAGGGRRGRAGGGSLAGRRVCAARGPVTSPRGCRCPRSAERGRRGPRSPPRPAPPGAARPMHRAAARR